MPTTSTDRPKMTDIRPGSTVKLHGQPVRVETDATWLNGAMRVSVTVLKTGQYRTQVACSEFTF